MTSANLCSVTVRHVRWIMRSPPCGGTQREIGRRPTNRRSRTKVPAPRGSTPICIARKATSPMPRIGTGAPAKRLLRAPWSTSGVKSRRRCWRNSLSGLHLQRRQLFARELLPAFHQRCRRLMHFGNGLRRLHGWRCVYFLQHGQQFHKGAAHSSEANSLRPPSAAPPCPLQRLQFLNGGVNLDSL